MLLCFFLYGERVKSPKVLQHKPVWIAAVFLALVCALHLSHREFLERLELVTYDFRFQTAIKFPSLVATNFGFVDIGEQDIKDVGEGKYGYSFGLYWPRQVYGRAARELHVQGAKVVAFDVLFAGLRLDHEQIITNDDQPSITSDQYFADIIGQAGNVIVAAEARTLPAPLFRENALAVGDISADVDVDGVLRRARAFQMYRIWNPRLQKQLAEDPAIRAKFDEAEIGRTNLHFPRPDGADPIDLPLDAQGRFDLEDITNSIPAGEPRFQKPFTDERVWHMGVAIAARGLGLDLRNAVIELERGRITLPGSNGVNRVIPVDKNGYFFINWMLPVNHPQLFDQSFGRLLQNDYERAKARKKGKEISVEPVWKNRLAVVGSSATGNDLNDTGPTPLRKKDSLVSKHWNVANSIITNQFVGRSPGWLELLLICLLGAGSALITIKCRPRNAALGVVALLVAYVFLCFAVFVKSHFWLPLIMPAFGGGFGCFVVETVYLVIFEQQDKKRVKGVFGKIVSPHVVDELLTMENLALAGTRRELTVMFSDIRGFTELTDVNRDNTEAFIKEHNLTGIEADAAREESASETLKTVNRYLSVVAEQVIANQGLVDKFIGDCVMAFWGAPVTNPRHALCAVKAALGAQRAVADLNREREEDNVRIDAENLERVAAGQPKLPRKPTLSVGTGLNTGTVTVGLMGWENHLVNYTVFGREVNIASRLEGVSGRGRVIISRATLDQIMAADPELGASCVRLDPVHVKGIRDDVEIFEVPWRTGKYAPTPIPAPPVVPSAPS